ncbi:MAG TPA: hypothetical protein VNO55_11535, partial [Polyangia bacterium]|nr:hypothetical protein [Polyangia bacterium]
ADREDDRDDGQAQLRAGAGPVSTALRFDHVGDELGLPPPPLPLPPEPVVAPPLPLPLPPEPVVAPPLPEPVPPPEPLPEPPLLEHDKAATGTNVNNSNRRDMDRCMTVDAAKGG